MSKDILVRLHIPLLAHPIVNTPAFIFSRWMPLNESDFIVVERDDATLKLWFDETCWHRGTPAGGAISNHINVLVNKVFVDVTLLGLSDELVDYIKVTASQPEPPRGPHKQAYRQLGQRVYRLAVSHVNRLIAYARSEKGQYWLQEYPVNKSEGVYAVNLEFNASVLIDSNWYRWFSDVRQLVIGREGECQETDRFIDQDSWRSAKQFVASEARPSLVWELIAGAEWLAGIGHRRSALTEAVTALEVAIANFSRSPNAEQAFGSLASERMDIPSLKKSVDHLGLSCTIRYLFPRIFSADKVPTAVLRECQEAIDERQNVVHNGQRDVKEAKLSKYVTAIRTMCRLLESYQAAD